MPKSVFLRRKDKNGKMTVRSNKAIRSLIIEAAWIAIKYDPALAKKFSELEKIKNQKKSYSYDSQEAIIQNLLNLD